MKWLVATGKVKNSQIRKARRDRELLMAKVKARLEALGGEDLRFLTGAAALDRAAPFPLEVRAVRARL